MDWTSQLLTWTKPASDHEEDKRDRTERQIREAILRHPLLGKVQPRIYAKGSYANNTNVRLDSDVDIAVEYAEGFIPEAAGDNDDQKQLTLRKLVDVTPVYSSFTVFKNDVEEALRSAFGSKVKRHNKCITIGAGATTLPADVVPCRTYRYFPSAGNVDLFYEGTVLFPDTGGRVTNYPAQHYAQGAAKNTATGTRYKKAVRALKRLESEIVAKGIIADVPSYLIECLLYEVPNSYFSGDDYHEILTGALAHIYSKTKGNEPAAADERLLEVNEIKFLFHSSQKWSRAQANQFAVAAFNYINPKS